MHPSPLPKPLKAAAPEEDGDLLLSVTSNEDAKEAEIPRQQLESAKEHAVGRDITTVYGKGKVVQFRAHDGMYTVELEGGAKLYSRNFFNAVKEKETSRDTDPSSACTNYTKRRTSMELNVAYEALEKMRRLNLEMQVFGEKGHVDVDFQHCTTCLLTRADTVRFAGLQKLVDDKGKKQQVVLPRIQKLLDNRQKAIASPCLICASPTCPTHASATFRKEKITLCKQCERLFELDFIVDCVSASDAKVRAQHVDHMVDLYDRSLLLLRYSAQYIDAIAERLEEKKGQQNKIGLGSSGVGVVSGALGIAAAATILTPAGPPLLIASLLFGGSATAVQTGTEMRNYFSEPNRLADRIIALHGISKSILRVTSTLRDALMRDHIRTDEYDAAYDMDKQQQVAAGDNSGKNRAGVLVGANVGCSITLGGADFVNSAISGAEVGAMGTRSATAFSRAGSAAARTIRFARFAGGALSAAVLVMEANAIQSTVRQIRAGSPCEKAETLRRIRLELDELPSTESLDGECQAYLKTLASRRYPATEAKESPKESKEAEIIMPSENLCEPGATIIDGETTERESNNAAVLSSSLTSSEGRLSLLKRIQLHKLRESVGSVDTETVVEAQELRQQDLDLLM